MNQNEVVDPGPSELAASKGKPSDTVQVRISPEEPTLGSNNNPWPAAFQTALHLHYSDAETPSGKYSERLVLIVAIIIVSTAVIGKVIYQKKCSLTKKNYIWQCLKIIRYSYLLPLYFLKTYSYESFKTFKSMYMLVSVLGCIRTFVIFSVF